MSETEVKVYVALWGDLTIHSIWLDRRKGKVLVMDDNMS